MLIVFLEVFLSSDGSMAKKKRNKRATPSKKLQFHNSESKAETNLNELQATIGHLERANELISEAAPSGRIKVNDRSTDEEQDLRDELQSAGDERVPTPSPECGQELPKLDKTNSSEAALNFVLLSNAGTIPVPNFQDSTGNIVPLLETCILTEQKSSESPIVEVAPALPNWWGRHHRHAGASLLALALLILIGIPAFRSSLWNAASTPIVTTSGVLESSEQQPAVLQLTEQSAAITVNEGLPSELSDNSAEVNEYVKHQTTGDTTSLHSSGMDREALSDPKAPVQEHDVLVTKLNADEVAQPLMPETVPVEEPSNLNLEKPAEVQEIAAAEPVTTNIPAEAFRLPLQTQLHGWFAQIAATPTEEEAQRLAARLMVNELEVVIQKALVNKQTYFRVLLGPTSSRTEAMVQLSSLQKGGVVTKEAYLRRF